MGLILAATLAILGAFAAILVSVISRILTDDVKAWLPWVTKRLLDASVRRLPKEEQERYAEEWLGHINEMPGDLAKFYVAVGYLLASQSIKSSVRLASTPATSRAVEALKRATDVIGAIVMLFLVLPLIIFTIVLIKLDSDGPVLFQQEQVGRKGERISVFRFRTMSLVSDRAGYSVRCSGDPRVTRIGMFLRQSSVDKLPQLINVLRGDISIMTFIRSLGLDNKIGSK